MATNDLLPFATDGGANVQSQAGYASNPDRDVGQAGGDTADALLYNKAVRQGSVGAAMLGEFIKDTIVQNVVDDGDIAALEDQFILSLRKAGVLYAADTGAVNHLIVTFDPPPASWTALVGLPMFVKVGHTTTIVAPDINPNGLGVKTIKNPDGTALVSGQIPIGAIAMLIYDGVEVQVASVTKQGGVQAILPTTAGKLAQFADTAGTIQNSTIGSGFFQSAEQTLDAGTSGGQVISASHGLAAPKRFEVTVICKSAEGNYSVGDEVKQLDPFDYGTAWMNATDVGASIIPFELWHIFDKLFPYPGHAGFFTPTAAKWKMILRVWE